jgi:transposase
MIGCKKCSSQNNVLSGFVRGHQRYKCKDCGCNFKLGDNRDKTKPEIKALSLLLYGSGKASYGMIARLFKVNRSTVLYWIKKMGSQLPEPPLDSEIEAVQFDEMWHFLCKKNAKFGYGGRWIVATTRQSDGLLAIVMLKPSGDYLKN